MREICHLTVMMVNSDTHGVFSNAHSCWRTTGSRGVSLGRPRIEIKNRALISHTAKACVHSIKWPVAEPRSIMMQHAGSVSAGKRARTKCECVKKLIMENIAFHCSIALFMMHN